MKCSSIKLVDRKNLKPTNFHNDLVDEQPSFITEKCHSYSFGFTRNKNSSDNVTLSITNIILPEHLESFNTGSSLNKWANKSPRLKSSKSNIKRLPSLDESLEQSLEMNFDTSFLPEYNDVNTCICHYEVHPDIQRLLLTTQEINMEQEQIEPKHRHKRKKRSKKDVSINDTDNNNRVIKKKKKLLKTITYSLSKPPSPETEQIIRVDVTSNYSVEEIENIETNRTDTNATDCSKGHARKIFQDRNELKRSLTKQEMTKSSDDEVDDFVVQCRKLVLSDRKQ